MTAIDDVRLTLALVPWLTERGEASLEQAAAEFGTTADRIRECLDHLDFCGLPGLRGGDLFEVVFQDEFVSLRIAPDLDKALRLSPDEGLRLVLVTGSVAAALGDEVPALTSALSKLRLAGGVPDGVSVLVEPGSEFLDEVSRAIRDHVQVKIRYRGRGDPEARDRTIEPWSLYATEGEWYVIGHDVAANGSRAFRLDRIETCAVTSVSAAVSRPNKMPRPHYEAADGDVKVRLRLEPQARWIAELLDLDSAKEMARGRMEITFRTDRPGWVVQLVLAAGGNALVKSPATLKRDVAVAAASAVAAYAS